MKKLTFRFPYFTITLLFFLFSITAVFSQKVVFSYDNFGNRSCQEVVTLKNEVPENEINESLYEMDDTWTIVNGVRVIIKPNPHKGHFIVQFKNLKPESEASMQLFDLTGERILDKKILTSIQPVDIDRYENGTYLLSVTIDGIRKTWRVIKQ